MREKLIELIAQVQDCGCDVTDVVEMNYVENDMLADYLIANGVTIQRWIPVTERLPEDRASVLCHYNGVFGQITRIARFANCLESVNQYVFYDVKRSGFYIYDSEIGYYEVNDVTHWMPLPEPPKGD